MAKKLTPLPQVTVKQKTRTEEVVLRGHPDSNSPMTATLYRNHDPKQPLGMRFEHVFYNISWSREEMVAMRDFINEILAEG